MNRVVSHSLNSYLNSLDDEIKVSQEDPTNKYICESIECIVGLIATELSRLDDRFESTVVRNGSYYSDVKIEKADEFDYMFYLKNLSKEGMYRAQTSRHDKHFLELEINPVYSNQFAGLYIEYPDESYVYDREFSIAVQKHGNAPKGSSPIPTRPKYFDVDRFQNMYSELVQEAISIVGLSDDFPDGWRLSDYSQELNHINKNSVGEKCRGKHTDVEQCFINGPSFTYDFVGTNSSTGKEIRINVDMCPFISLQESNSVLHTCGMHLALAREMWAFERVVKAFDASGVILVPAKVEYGIVKPVWKISAAMLEYAVLAQFSFNSVEKRCLRILKLLRKRYLRKKPEEVVSKSASFYSDLVDPETMVAKLNDCPISDEERSMQMSLLRSIKSHISAVEKLNQKHPADDEKRYCLASSYQIKLAWMHVILTESSLPKWHEDEVGDRVLLVLKTFREAVFANDRDTDIFFKTPMSSSRSEICRDKIIKSVSKLIDYLESK